MAKNKVYHSVLPDTTPLADVKTELRAHWKEGGIVCPACTQLVNLYPRPIHSTMVYLLVRLFLLDREQPDFYHVKDPYTHSAIPATTITHFEKISRTNPTDRDELENLLLQTEYFFCLDTFTILKLEAVLCGAITILFENPDFPKQAYEASEYGLAGCIWVGKGESVAEQIVKQLGAAQLTLPVARVYLKDAYNNYAEQLLHFTEISQEYAL